jgi:hypothetical protein
MITISKLNLYRTLRSVALFQSKDETRAHLGGVQFEGVSVGNRLHVVATDGHTLIHAQPVTASVKLPTAFWLNAGQVKTALAHLKCTTKTDMDITIAGSVKHSGQIVIDGLAFQTALKCGMSFPPWRQVLPDKQDSAGKGCALFGLNPGYLGRVSRACEYFTGSKDHGNRGLEISTRDELGGVRFDYSQPDDGDLCAVVMPMRI